MLRIASLTLVVGAALLMTWALATARPHRAEPPPQIAELRVPAPAAEDIASEVKRLHTRLAPPAKYPAPSRDPFRFGRESERTPREVPVPPPPVAAPAPELPRLVAIMSDSSSGAPSRRAALGLGPNVRIVAVGDTIGSFRVAAITADDVELVETASGKSFHVTLR
jgi:hypothetical protein